MDSHLEHATLVHFSILVDNKLYTWAPYNWKCLILWKVHFWCYVHIQDGFHYLSTAPSILLVLEPIHLLTALSSMINT
jgi:hypothetical protein